MLVSNTLFWPQSLDTQLGHLHFSFFSCNSCIFRVWSRATSSWKMDFQYPFTHFIWRTISARPARPARLAVLVPLLSVKNHFWQQLVQSFKYSHACLMLMQENIVWHHIPAGLLQLSVVPLHPDPDGKQGEWTLEVVGRNLTVFGMHQRFEGVCERTEE